MELRPEYIIYYRKRLGWSQKEFAKQAGVSVNRIWKYERGVSNAHPATVKKLAETLGVPVEKISVLTDPEPIEIRQEKQKKIASGEVVPITQAVPSIPESSIVISGYVKDGETGEWLAEHNG